MQLTIAAVGKLKAGPERMLYERYSSRTDSAGNAVGIGPVAEIEVTESRKKNVRERRGEEADALLAKIPRTAALVTLDEKGKSLTSEQFARLLAKERDAGVSTLAFILGGPDGHDARLREGAKCVISLGAITLPHGLARVVLAEQLYRAVTILAGHPYHRG